MLDSKWSIQTHSLFPDNMKKTASIIIITHKCKEINSNKCIKMLKSDSNIIKEPNLIRLF